MKSLRLLAIALLLPVVVPAYELAKKWETSPALFTPESVLCDAAGKVLYVSNLGAGKDAWAQDGNGSIAKVALDGTVIAAEWVKGLNGPKGLGLHAGKLYAADLDSVVVIDVASGAIEQTIRVEGAVGLNDLTIDAAGVVYVSDFKAGKVYAITQGKSALHVEGMQTPNGLLAVGHDLYVLDKGVLFKVGSERKPVKIVDGLEGGTDGIEQIAGDEFLVSCWGGVLYAVDAAKGEKHLLLDTRPEKKNSADLGYDAAHRIAYVPTFWGNTVVAYELK